jgi:hypothetical protein
MGRKKSFALLLVFVFFASLVLIPQATVKAQPKTIVVPDDYPTIQAAIGNASAGDTVYVKKGTYFYNGWGGYGGNIDGITIDKSISLIGEDKNTTMIQTIRIFKGNSLRSGIHVTADFVTISGFTMDKGILISAEDNTTRFPYGCRIIDNNLGVIEDHGISNLISGNNLGGIMLYSWSTIVSGNNLTAIEVGFGENVTIKQNNFVGEGQDTRSNVPPRDTGGLLLNNNGRGPIYIYENNILNSDFGIKFQETNNCFIYNNNIMGNRVGIYLPNEIVNSHGDFLGTGNKVYNNNLNNTKNVLVEQANSYLDSLNETRDDITGNGTASVSWYNGFVGNYWSDYNSLGAYEIDQSNIDYFPQISPVDISVGPPILPFSTVVITIITIPFVIAIIIVLLIYFKKYKKHT